MRFHFGPLLAIVALLSLATPCRGGAGYSLTATPSLGLSAEHDGNVLNRAGGGPDDMAFVVSPALAADLKLLGGQFRFQANGNARWHKEHPELDRVGWSREAALRTVSPLLLSPRVAISPEGGVTWREDDTRQAVGDAPGGTSLPERASGVTRVRESRARIGASVKATALDTFDLSATWRDFRFPDDNAAGVGSRSYGIDGSAQHIFSPRTTVGLYGSANRGEYENDTVSGTVAGGLTGTYNLSPVSVLTLRGGYSVLYRDGGDMTGTPDAMVSLTRRTELDTFRLAAARKFEVGGGLGTATRRTSVNGGWDRAITEKVTGRIEGGWEKRESEDAASPVDTDVLQGLARLTWRPYRYLSCHVTGSTLRNWNRLTPGEDLRKEVVTVGITLSDSYPLL